MIANLNDENKQGIFSKVLVRTTHYEIVELKILANALLIEEAGKVTSVELISSNEKAANKIVSTIISQLKGKKLMSDNELENGTEISEELMEHCYNDSHER